MGAPTEHKIVWVLGAGFSKSLGGPLLRDVFAPGSFGLVRAIFKEDRFKTVTGVEAKTVHYLYNYGVAFKHGYLRDWPEKVKGVRLWDDAEQFLDFLEVTPDAQAIELFDEAFEQSDKVPPKDGTWSPARNLSQLRLTARRLFAAECCRFMDAADLSSERWGPYRKWLSELNQQHCVITFNYDTVLERLNLDCARRMNGFEPLYVFHGGGGLPTETRQRKAIAFKLHGSTNWRRTGQGVAVPMEDDFFALGCREEELLLATPGSSKSATTANDLPTEWAEADFALRNATAIVFLGYRFPPTDGQARTMLLEAIRQNQKRKVAIHTVLGPDTKSADSLRLESLIESAILGRLRLLPGEGMRTGTPYYSLSVHPLLAEDFIAVVPFVKIIGPVLGE